MQAPADHGTAGRVIPCTRSGFRRKADELTYIRQCAWCKKVEGIKVIAGGGDRPDTITHTICAGCRALILKEIESLQPERALRAIGS